MTTRYSALLLLATLGAASSAEAQRSDGLRHLAVVGGPVEYDLSGTGTSWGAGARLDLPLARVLTVEGGLTYFQYETQGAFRARYLFPEVGAHFVVPTPVVRPYVLAGAGAALLLEAVASDGSGAASGSETELAVHAGLGIRTAGAGPWGGRIEARFRNITLDANASMLEVFVGLSRRW